MLDRLVVCGALREFGSSLAMNHGIDAQKIGAAVGRFMLDKGLLAEGKRESNYVPHRWREHCTPLSPPTTQEPSP